MNFHSERVDFVMDFLWISPVDFLGPSFPLNEETKDQKIHREIHSKIHDQIPAKSTHVVKNGVGTSTLQEEGPDKVSGLPSQVLVLPGKRMKNIEKWSKILGQALRAVPPKKPY